MLPKWSASAWAWPIERAFADKGYHGHSAPPDYKFRALSRVRGGGSPRRSNARCAGVPAVEPVISHIKAEDRMGRNYL
jgi:hypothetical protein